MTLRDDLLAHAALPAVRFGVQPDFSVFAREGSPLMSSTLQRSVLGRCLPDPTRGVC